MWNCVGHQSQEQQTFSSLQFFMQIEKFRTSVTEWSVNKCANVWLWFFVTDIIISLLKTIFELFTKRKKAILRPVWEKQPNKLLMNAIYKIVLKEMCRYQYYEYTYIQSTFLSTRNGCWLLNAPSGFHFISWKIFFFFQ